MCNLHFPRSIFGNSDYVGKGGVFPPRNGLRRKYEIIMRRIIIDDAGSCPESTSFSELLLFFFDFLLFASNFSFPVLYEDSLARLTLYRLIAD